MHARVESPRTPTLSAASCLLSLGRWCIASVFTAMLIGTSVYFYYEARYETRLTQGIVKEVRVVRGFGSHEDSSFIGAAFGSYLASITGVIVGITTPTNDVWFGPSASGCMLRISTTDGIVEKLFTDALPAAMTQCALLRRGDQITLSETRDWGQRSSIEVLFPR